MKTTCQEGGTAKGGYRWLPWAILPWDSREILRIIWSLKVEAFPLLGCHAASVGSWLPTFRSNLQGPNGQRRCCHISQAIAKQTWPIFEAMYNSWQHDLFWERGSVSPSHNPQAGGPPVIGCLCYCLFNIFASVLHIWASSRPPPAWGCAITHLRKKRRKERGMTLSSAWTTQEDIYTGNFCFGLWEAVIKPRKEEASRWREFDYGFWWTHG